MQVPIHLPPKLPLSTGHQETARNATGHVVVDVAEFPEWCWGLGEYCIAALQLFAIALFVHDAAVEQRLEDSGLTDVVQRDFQQVAADRQNKAPLRAVPDATQYLVPRNSALVVIPMGQESYYFQAHLNLTHAAGVVARAANCEPDEGFWRSIAGGFSIDHDLIYDDINGFDLKSGKRIEYKWGDDPKRDAHKRVVDQISIDELKALAPHRHVIRRSESDWPDYSYRSDGDPAPVGDEWLALNEQAKALS